MAERKGPEPPSSPLASGSGPQASGRVAAPRPRLANETMRIDMDELDRLRQASRGPLPGLTRLLGLLGKSLDDPEVEDLGLREKKAASGVGYVASSKALGLEVTTSRSRNVETILLHSQNHDGFHAWPGDLGGLTFSSTAAEARKLKGLPTRSGSGWDRWDTSTSCLRLDYGDGGIRLITLLTAGAP